MKVNLKQNKKLEVKSWKSKFRPHTSNLKDHRGITLIALIITIIILLILAVVSIKIATGDGLINKAQSATKKYNEAQELERVNLAVTDAKLANNGGSITLENLKTGLDNQFGANNYTFSSETLPYKFTINNGTGASYTIYSDGYVMKIANISNEEILSEYALSGTVSNGIYTFDNDNLTNAYDAILAKYGKTVQTTDLLTAYCAYNRLVDIYNSQSDLDATGLSNALKSNFFVEVDGKTSYYSSDFGYTKEDDFWSDLYESLSTEEKAKYDSSDVEAYKIAIQKNIGYLRGLQIQYLADIYEIWNVQKMDDNSYIIADDGVFYSSEEDYANVKETMSLTFLGGWITSSNIKYETTSITNELPSFRYNAGVEQINENTDMSKYTVMGIPGETAATYITDDNIEEMRQKLSNKIVFYCNASSNAPKYAGQTLFNCYVIDLNNATACYLDSNGNIIEGRFK